MGEASSSGAGRVPAARRCSTAASTTTSRSPNRPRGTEALARPRCFCGCGAPAVIQHHAVYQQAVRRTAASLDDPRNLVWVAHRCHERHHSRTAPFTLAMLPDAVYEFAADALGAGPAYEWLKRRYSGEDARLEALIASEPS